MDYSKYVGKRIANMNSKIYSRANGIVGQCVWYVRCRALEKCNKNTGIYGNANTWYNTAIVNKIPTGKTPETNSIACFNNGTYGHVIFVEYVDNSFVYYTEANANADNRMSADDGVLKKITIKAFTSRKGYQGCIYLCPQKYKSMKVTAKDGLNYRTSCKVAGNNKAGTLSFGAKVSVLKNWSKTAEGYKWYKIKMGKKHYYCVSNWLV